ncbi:hypothetical protein M407DRAFT_34904 [Tulasnella calospora MUT 4182]|uniref:Uncharacterized protein n=1 Tax=Tulasnella calospora MUT 4182 TaxID=1051891 RepID=A0A0C3PZW1_9AGAM|nr:hypothetical protein M407DRAFT_34904 [Tulasnella calospora MUT 4182]
MTAAPYHNDILATKNAQLHHELEEFRASKVSTIQSGQLNFANSIVPNEVGLNIMGLTVSDPPLVCPIAKRASPTVGDTHMVTN